MSEQQVVNEGWGWPSNSKKAHYFVGVTSLCGGWAYFGNLERGEDESPDNCAKCKRLLAKRRAKAGDRE